MFNGFPSVRRPSPNSSQDCEAGSWRFGAQAVVRTAVLSSAERLFRIPIPHDM
uniref:Uncharacterized protein n=1 Tax=Anguilla anguilla TaxID=7936 RepID=A0A0E9W5L5_ANGAN